MIFFSQRTFLPLSTPSSHLTELETAKARLSRCLRCRSRS
ncbi:hypothetical protein Ahy_B01g052799 isoform D [Arachis hypogaea]|uniref:Uncharacterized protein n=1 Tax=Arachis hypogaea TaxID=3818 RepID=A0A445AQI3_ARAHY|nr:hypothetical protein Ahy_B01g052799 isoform D [Arachis hypogaea]